VEKHIGKALRLLMGVMKNEGGVQAKTGTVTQTSTSQLRSDGQFDE
jgi:hypothetical protein